MSGGRYARLVGSAVRSGYVPVGGSRRPLAVLHRFMDLARCLGSAGGSSGRVARFVSAVCVTQIVAIVLVTTAYASDGKLVRRDDGYYSADTALAGFFGYSPAEAVSVVTKTKYDGFPNYEIACSYIALADDGWWYYSGDANTLYAAKAELFGEYSPTGGGGGGHAFDPPAEPKEPSEVDGYTILRGGTENGYQFNLVPVATGGTGGYTLDISRNTTDIDRWRSSNLTIAVGVKGKNDTTVKYPIFIGFETGINLVRAPSGSVGLYNSSDSAKTYSFIRYNPDWEWSVGSSGMIQMSSGGNTTGNGYTLASKAFTTIYGTNLSQIDYFCCQGASSTPVEPPTDPSGGGDDEPSAPEPPEIDPTEYTTYTTNNTDIDVNVTIDNDGGQTDLTPITLRLDRIYARLGDIGSDLLDLDLHMQTAFYDLGNRLDGLFSAYFGSVGTWLQMIYNRLEDINRNIQQLDKSTDDLTDLSGVQSYLMQILQTLQGMGNNSPAADPTDLSGVLHELGTIEDLLRDINKPTSPRFSPTVDPDDDDGIGKQIADKSVELAKKFPFSIPWDVHKILSMFEAEPVAPQFDLPVFGMEDEVHIDMSSWEPVAVVTRNATTILFALGLALRTRTMIGGNND